MLGSLTSSGLHLIQFPQYAGSTSLFLCDMEIVLWVVEHNWFPTTIQPIEICCTECSDNCLCGGTVTKVGLGIAKQWKCSNFTVFVDIVLLAMLLFAFVSFVKFIGHLTIIKTKHLKLVEHRATTGYFLDYWLPS